MKDISLPNPGRVDGPTRPKYWWKRPSSAIRIASSRRNGARSQGPVTPEGKQRSSRNAITHGMLAETVVQDEENRALFLDIVRTLENNLRPVNAVAYMLLQNMAVCQWRQLRACSIEKSSFDQNIAARDASIPSRHKAAQAFEDLGARTRVIDLLHRYETRADRQFARALKLFREINRPDPDYLKPDPPLLPPSAMDKRTQIPSVCNTDGAAEPLPSEAQPDPPCPDQAEPDTPSEPPPPMRPRTHEPLDPCAKSPNRINTQPTLDPPATTFVERHHKVAARLPSGLGWLTACIPVLQMARLLTRTLSSVALVGGLLALRLTVGHVPPGQLINVQRPMMGTIWNIEVIDHGRPDEARLAIDRAYSELTRIDNLMSEWKPDSPISQVNAAAGLHPVEVPAELRALLERSVAFSRSTEGTFDVTWRGMGNIWHFDDAFRVPTQAQVEAGRRRVDYRRLQIDGNRIYLPAGMNIGLGGIAKGYAVDRAAALLKSAGFPDSLVDGGGDVMLSGTRFGQPWRLGIQDPRGPHGSIIGAMAVTNAALVTSGDYERFRMVDGVRYHHIIDPRTGYPAGASVSVSVLSKTAEEGVVLAKGVFILGPDRGMALARRQSIDALLIDPQLKRYSTPGFDKYFHPEESK